MDNTADMKNLFMASSNLGWLMARVVYQKHLTDSHLSALIRTLEEAHAARRFDVLDHFTKALCRAHNQGPHVRHVGDYFAGLVLLNQKLVSEAATLFERAVDRTSPLSSRATLSLSAVAAMNGDTRAQICAYLSAARSRDSLTLLQANRALAVIEALKGNHKGAVDVLEGLFSFARSVASRHPASYCDYINSLSYELLAVGRVEEAERASRLVLASPYYRAYPEWHETRADIEGKCRRGSRSVVSVGDLRPPNVLEFQLDRLQACRTIEEGQPSDATGLLLAFPERPMNKKQTSNDKGETQSDLSLQEKQKEAIRLLLYDDATDDEAIDTVLKILKLSTAERKRVDAHLDTIAKHSQDENA